MTKNNHKSSVFLMAAIALLAWIALGIQLNLLLEHGEQSGLTVGGTLARYFGYFTILKAVGAEVIVCPTNVMPEDPRSYYSVAKRLAQEIPNS